MYLRRSFILIPIALALIALSACGSGAESEPALTATPAPFLTPTSIPRFVPSPTPGAAAVAEPLAEGDAITVEGIPLQVSPPGECRIVENLAEPNRLGSARAFDYKLGEGFGCPASSNDSLRLQEIQLFTPSSLTTYDTQCASGSCEAARVTTADYDAQRAAWLSGEDAPGWTLLDIAGRRVLARSVPVDGSPATMRQYAEFCGDVRVENWVVMLGEDTSALEPSADEYFASLSLVCQSGG